MQNKTKKFISAFLTLAMMLGLFWAMPMTASTEGEICQIGSIKYSKFADALISVPEGGSTPTVIKLLDNIKIEQEYGAYIISNQKITFDLNGYDLIFASTLHVEKKSIIDYIGTGNFKVIVNTTLNSDYSNKVALEVIESSMKLTGVEIRDNGTGNYAMVVALACDGSSSYPGSVVVNGDVKAVGNGKETSYGIGVSAQGGAVTVTGNIINENIKSDTTGVEVILGGTVTVNGDIGAHPSKYVSFNNTYKTKEDFTTPTTKAGYKTYTDGTNTVWVKEDADLPILIIPPIYDFKFIAIINLQPEDSQIMEGENTSFHIDAFGAGYQWQYRLNIAGAAWLDLSNKGVYSDVTTDTLILTEVPLIYNGYQYRCVVHGFSADSVIESESAKLTVTAAPATEPTTPEDPKPFPMTDLSPTDWFYNNVKTAWEMGLVNGKTPTTYEPTANLTYAEAVKLAACMHQYYQEGNVTLVIGTTNWYDTYVEYAMTNGIISKDYEWNTYATRAGYMEIFANALPDEALGAQNIVVDGSIPDVPMSHPQAAAIYKLYRAGIVQGVDNVTHACNPGSNIQRSEVAAIIDRMMNPTSRVTFTLG